MFCYEYIAELRRHRRNPESSDMLRRTDSESRVSDSCLHITTLVCLIMLYNFISIGPLWFCFAATCFLFWRKSFLSFVYKWIYERSYILTSEKDMKTRLIIPVIYNLDCCEIKAWKKFLLKRDSNRWPVWYQCSALRTELSSHQGAGHVVNA